MRKLERVFVAGHRGLVGSAVMRALKRHNLPTPLTEHRSALNLANQAEVLRYFRENQPQAVVLAAAKVGGIGANNRFPWDFLIENLAIENSVLTASLECNVERVVFLGSSCIYPKHAVQPITEAALLTGPLEPTNEPYALAKIVGVKLVEAANRQHGKRWVSLMPTNLYGPHDNFDPETSHVLPAMINKFHTARMERMAGEDAKVQLWGSGTALREFLHVDDVADAVVLMLGRQDTGWFNVGYGEDISIRDLAGLVATTVGYDGPVEWDSFRPDGTPRKLLDSSRLRAIGWRPRIGLHEGLRATYEWYRDEITSGLDRQTAIRS